MIADGWKNSQRNLNRPYFGKKIIRIIWWRVQRVAICATILKEADVYFFDEPSSYLDIHERMRVVA